MGIANSLFSYHRCFDLNCIKGSSRFTPEVSLIKMLLKPVNLFLIYENQAYKKTVYLFGIVEGPLLVLENK